MREIPVSKNVSLEFGGVQARPAFSHVTLHADFVSSQ
jgi:hypothetical protein